LMEYAIDWAKKFAKQLIADHNGILAPVGKPTKNFLGRSKEVRAVQESLYKKRMRNCVVVGGAGIGKTEIVKRAIATSKSDDVFLSLDVAFLQAGCTLVGQFEERMKNILTAIANFNSRSDAKISLFVDEIHSLWTINKNEMFGTVSAADMLKPYLSNGDVTIVGATTMEEYRKYVLRDKALLRRLPPVFVEEMSDEDTARIIKAFFGKELADGQIEECIALSKEIKYLRNPDCALEIADRVCAKSFAEGRMVETSEIKQIADMMKEVA